MLKALKNRISWRWTQRVAYLCSVQRLTWWKKYEHRKGNHRILSSSMFAAATSFFARTNISQSYNIGSSVPQGIGNLSRPATPGGNTTSLTAPAAATPAFFVGLWKVQSAWHKVTNKRVSVWIFDKRGSDIERLSPQGKERVIEVMKAEVSCMKFPLPKS